MYLFSIFFFQCSSKKLYFQLNKIKCVLINDMCKNICQVFFKQLNQFELINNINCLLQTAKIIYKIIFTVNLLSFVETQMIYICSK